MTPPGVFLFYYFMSLSLDTPRCENVGSGRQTGKPVNEAGVPDEESTVGTKLGNTAGKFFLDFDSINDT